MRGFFEVRRKVFYCFAKGLDREPNWFGASWQPIDYSSVSFSNGVFSELPSPVYVVQISHLSYNRFLP